MKIALLRPPEVNRYWHESRPPLGISYLASYLELNKVETRIFDANFNAWTKNETFEAIAAYHPDLVGLTSMTHEIFEAHSLASEIKSILYHVPTVIGGCHITALPRETLMEFSSFDFGIYGEAENTVLQLVQFLQADVVDRFSDIDGLVYRDTGGVHVNPPRRRLSARELDNLPYPAFNQFYPHKEALKGKNEYYVMMASRGCPFNCAFCMQVLGREVVRRSPENIVEEMEFAVERYAAHTIYFLDEIFLFNDQHTYDTLKLIRKRGLPDRIRWRALTHVRFIDENLVRLARESGCFSLELGLESGSDEILKIISKNITVQQAEMAVRIIKDAGISVEANFILGHPYETPETVRATVDFAARLNPNTIAVGLMIPYPGTRVYEMAKRGEGGYKLLTRNWSKYDKYGGRALELEGLTHRELEKWQKKALLVFYLRNFRILDLVKFIIKYRSTILYLFLKRFGGK